MSIFNLDIIRSNKNDGLHKEGSDLDADGGQFSTLIDILTSGSIMLVGGLDSVGQRKGCWDHMPGLARGSLCSKTEKII